MQPSDRHHLCWEKYHRKHPHLSADLKSRLLFLILGISSIFWLIFRSGRKPSRLAYPCQKLALSESLIFLSWIASIFSGHFLYRKIKHLPKKLILLPLILILFFAGIKSYQIYQYGTLPKEIWGQNNKSRVVWITNNQAARSWDGRSWDQRADQSTVSRMADQAVIALTGQSSIRDAWTRIFTNHNGGRDYQAGEKIAIKINDNNSCRKNQIGTSDDTHCPLIQPLYALIDQLVNEKGLPQGNITIYDVSRAVPDYIEEAILRDFPNIRMGDNGDCSNQSVWGAPLANDLVNADYLINMPLLRTHGMAGVSLSFKNHLGSTCKPDSFHNSFFDNTPSSNGLVALNSNNHIKNKTILVFDDAIYGLKSGGPYNNPDSGSGIKPYPNSLFLSTDPVAADSVMTDYLQSKIGFSPGNWIGDVRNYLRTAASAGLGNFGESCNGGSCTFSYNSIELVRCESNCPGTPTVPAVSPTRTPPTATNPPNPTATNKPSSSPTPPKTGSGDANGDGKVDFNDVMTVLNNWLRNITGIIDQLADGKINSFDFALVVSRLISQPTTNNPQPTTYNPPLNSEWTQDAHDAQRTGYTPEDPGTGNNWSFAWFWASPANSNPPREGRSVTGDNKVYLPAGSSGLYALNIANGSQAWHVNGTFKAAPAYNGGFVYAGSNDGKVYKINSSSGAATTYDAKSPVNKSILIANNYVYAVSSDGKLHKINPSSMTSVWVYTTGSNGATPPAYSPSKSLLVFATADLYVHAVNDANGAQKWRVKPSPNSPGSPNSSGWNSFNWGWPVIAEQHGVVLIRQQLPHQAHYDGPNNGRFGSTNAESKSWLQSNPQNKNLFALDINNGSEKFTAAVGYGSTEDNIDGSSVGVMGTQPVVKVWPGSSEVTYIPFRSSQGVSTDYRWSGHMGEMVMDNTTIGGLEAGDLRFVKMNRDGSQGGNSYIHIIDEETPVTVAADTIFHAHWAASTSVRITDRSSLRGLSYSNPIQTTNNLSSVVRALKNCSTPENLGAHKTSCGLSYVTDGGRYLDGPGFWAYLNVPDPPGWKVGSGNTANTTYSAGFLPRYTYVSNGYIIVEGNGGDLFVLKHN